MKKILYKSAFVLAACLLTVGCSDFLETNKWGMSKDWKTEADVDKAVNALYMFTSQDATSARGFMWFECCSDNLVVGRARASAEDIRNFKMPATNNDDQKENWKIMYELNANANNLIKVVPNMVGLSDAYKSKTLGISYFFRGFAMLWLAPWYGDNGSNGGIPIILDTTEPVNMDKPRPASVLMNYDQIISDLRTAADRLPLFSELSEDQYGLPHKAAAWAFAARAALYAAQYDAKYYDVVIEMTGNIMALGGKDKRELFDNSSSSSYENLWTRENNFSSEYIFSMLGNANAGPIFHGVSFNQDGYGIINTWGYYQPTLDLWNSFEANDTRRSATILRPGDKISFVGREVLFGGTNSGKTWSISSTSGMTFRKFLSPYKNANCLGVDVSTNGNSMSNTLATCLMRYADVVLMRAEALIWKNGEGNAEAKTLLNKIRKRASLSENSAATKDELKRERRCELAFEYQPSRHLDLIRWKDAKATYAKPTQGITFKLDANGVPTIDPTPQDLDKGRSFDPNIHHVFPIPADAFAGAVNLKQNKGYN